MTTPAIPLAHLSRELAALTGKEPPAYRTLYQMVLDGRVPATAERGRWSVQRADLARIAELVGLTAAPAPRRRARRAEVEQAAA